MIYVSAFTWLVHDLLPDQPTLLGGPLFICGCARVDVDADLLTVSAYGQRECTHIAGADVLCLARRLLRQMHVEQA